MWPILVEFRSPSSEIRRRKRRKKEEERRIPVKYYKSADRYVGRPNETKTITRWTEGHYKICFRKRYSLAQHDGRVGQVDRKFFQVDQVDERSTGRSSGHLKNAKSIAVAQLDRLRRIGRLHGIICVKSWCHLRSWTNPSAVSRCHKVDNWCKYDQWTSSACSSMMWPCGMSI